MACSKDRTFEIPRDHDKMLIECELKKNEYCRFFNDVLEEYDANKLIEESKKKDYCHYFNDVIEEDVEEAETSSSSFKLGAGSSRDELKMNVEEDIFAVQQELKDLIDGYEIKEKTSIEEHDSEIEIDRLLDPELLHNLYIKMYGLETKKNLVNNNTIKHADHKRSLKSVYCQNCGSLKYSVRRGVLFGEKELVFTCDICQNDWVQSINREID